jgi:hypothetical protein
MYSLSLSLLVATDVPHSECISILFAKIYYLQPVSLVLNLPPSLICLPEVSYYRCGLPSPQQIFLTPTDHEFTTDPETYPPPPSLGCCVVVSGAPRV